MPGGTREPRVHGEQDRERLLKLESLLTSATSLCEEGELEEDGRFDRHDVRAIAQLLSDIILALAGETRRPFGEGKGV